MRVAKRSLLQIIIPVALASTATACGNDPVSLSPSTALDAPTLSAVRTALLDEHHASAVYTQVMHQFGAVAPFVNIERAERQHAASLASLLTSRGIPVPSAPALTQAPQFSSVSAACAASVDAEVANIALYDELLATSMPADVRRVFENNRRASLENHLPAFARCGPDGNR